MRKSWIDRIFPHPSEHFPSRHESDRPWNSNRAVHPASILSDTAANSSQSILSSLPSLSPSQKLSRSRQGEPLSSSLLHHDDPFLPVERASKALQDTIQTLLDAQSIALNGRINPELVESFSNGSLTPTPTTASELQNNLRRTIPIRQPIPKKITLRSARRRLQKCMHDFAILRKEELRMLEQESKSRTDALERVNNFESKRDRLTEWIESIQAEKQATAADKFRNEATKVESEIRELEHRLLELRVRHRHLLAQAEQIENSLESKASSYKSSLLLVDRDVKDFLKRPPVTQTFANTMNSGMYALQPHRRTLQMAQQQWSSEQEAILQRTADVEKEHHALVEGERVWADAVRRIDDFETKLRSSTDNTLQSSSKTKPEPHVGFTEGLSDNLTVLITSLQSDFNHAQEQNWNLLVCALGAEIDACLEARDLLKVDRETSSPSASGSLGSQSLLFDNAEVPVTARQSPQKPSHSPAISEQSNQSLKDTLANFRSDAPSVLQMNQDEHADAIKPRYESEDDEPPDDFLLSH